MEVLNSPMEPTTGEAMATEQKENTQATACMNQNVWKNQEENLANFM